MEGLNCGECFQQFNEQNRQPRGLPCGHSLCTICIKYRIINLKLTCPFCRKVYRVSTAAKFSINFSLLNIVRTLSAKGKLSSLDTSSETSALAQEPNVHAGICQEHDSYKQFWCSKCDLWICPLCVVMNHPICPWSVNSITEVLDNIKEREIKLLDQSEIYSKSHIHHLEGYKKSLRKCDKQHNELTKGLFSLINLQQLVKIKLDKRKRLVDNCLFDFRETLRKISVAKKGLTEKESNTSIDVAAVEQESRELLQMSKGAEYDQGLLVGCGAIDVCEKFQKKLLAAIGVAASAINPLRMTF